MPDIDTDICYVKRHLVVDYLASKYGESHVAQIVTLGPGGQGGNQGCGPFDGSALNVVGQVNKLIPNTPGTTLKSALKEAGISNSSSRTIPALPSSWTLPAVSKACRVIRRPMRRGCHYAGRTDQLRPAPDYLDKR